MLCSLATAYLNAGQNMLLQQYLLEQSLKQRDGELIIFFLTCLE